jgi:outer membrane protein assembly factor BamA
VRLEAEVREGPLCRLSEIEFGGYRALAADDLRAAFPIKPGDIFVRSKIARGLEGLRDLYASRGFLDSMAIPKTEIASGAAVKLTLTVKEGPQYRVGKFEVLATPEVAGRFTQWKLAPGAVYDASYVKTFLEANSSLLPSDFVQASRVEVVKNCPDATVSVYLKLGQDRQQAGASHEKSVPCKSDSGE